VSQHDPALDAVPEYRGRRRLTPAAEPAEALLDPLRDPSPETLVEAPPPLTRRQLLEQRRALEEALEQSRESEPPPPLTRRQVVEQRRSESSHVSLTPSLAAAALGAASVALVAAVAAHVYGGSFGPASAAADLTTAATGSVAGNANATTTADQASSDVDPEVALAALRLGATPALPAGLRAASRSKFRAILPGCDGKVTDYDYPNGQIPADELCTLNFDPRHHLRADAAVALAKLNIAYRARFGENVCLTDSYRTLASQESLAARKPGLAARPGTSEHGLGLAVDFCAGVQTYRSQRYDWMRANAPTFGWQNPAWAIPPSSREEPWHWEYVVGEARTAAS
jgi:zinc D-Ala-D-Ala carboxypeptidase